MPFALRAPLAYEPGLVRVVARVFADSLLRWYERRLAPGDYRAQGGLFTVIQRSSGDMRPNPHLHVVALDGLYVAGSDGLPLFRPLGHLKTDEVADVLQIAKVRLEIVGDPVVQDCGFNLHAKTRAGAVDDDARARLLRYVLRPPLARRVGSWPVLPATNHRGKVWKPFQGFPD